MKHKILSLYGGHGSVFLAKELNMHLRPDVIFHNNKTFDVGYNFDDKPTNEHIIEFKKRTFGWYTLNVDITIEENMVQYLTKINGSNKMVMLSGELCRMGSFFTRNYVKTVLCIVRHPLHAMVSYLVNRHNEKVTKFKNGFNSNECVEYYAKIWNDVIGDHLNANSTVIRYEFAKEDTVLLTKDDIQLKHILANYWKSNTRNFGVLKPQFEELLKQLVKVNYDKLYETWDV